MIYITGDIHGDTRRIINFSEKMGLTEQDVVIILGDVGVNYYGHDRDSKAKRLLSSVNPTVFCIHGNHEMRPANIPSYQFIEWNGGKVWKEERYPNLLFAKDGEIFSIENKRFFVLGGAYSVDKEYRLLRNFGWWVDEQPSDEIKAFAEQQLNTKPFDFVLSHTCPFRYEPTEVFLPFIDQTKVDTSTEHWLDQIEQKANYQAWFCGHWHINKRIDKIHFLFDGWEIVE